MIMVKESKKIEGPSCACGKGDLYSEWLKLHENEKEEVSDSTVSTQAVDDNSSADDPGKESQKPLQNKK